MGFLQKQLTINTSSISITQTTAILTPLRGSLQAVVSLHALLSIIEGFQCHEDKKMIEYCYHLVNNDSYRKILPESILTLFQEILSYEKNPTESEETSKETPTTLSSTTIIIDEALIQQPSLLRSSPVTIIIYRLLETDFHINYVCRECKGISCILDINTAVIILSCSQLSPEFIRNITNILTESILAYTRIILLLSTDQTQCSFLSSLLQCLQASVLLFPVPVSILYW